ncbi:hypothetical protein BpHYR1_044547 [Brachionus plicatilis]|uniref:Uncharacterized protein n=1 Tax=Brachionus plicatilis TaxID=10195 RepID=A0A3M7R1Q0_BRAPC|nr:hypothetical protein BpHYR1_044547 [Brachionus plicatilis]
MTTATKTMTIDTDKPKTATKTITIDTDKPKTSIFKDKLFLIKGLRFALTFFYGQLFANAIYENLIRGISYAIEDPTTFPIIKITIGGLFFFITIFSMVAIWRKIRILIFISAVILILFSLFALIVSVIDLVLRNNKNQLTGTELKVNIAEITVESIFRVIAIVLHFYMIKLLRTYERVPSSA